jgi:hypothetical protein
MIASRGYPAHEITSVNPVLRRGGIACLGAVARLRLARDFG